MIGNIILALGILFIGIVIGIFITFYILKIKED